MKYFAKRKASCFLFLILLLVISSSFTFTPYKVSGDEPVSGKNGMVATAHPLATKAALDILKKGGNAVDAAVAAAFAIGVVEPDGSGLGGGGGMVVYLAKEKKSFYINYYQKASANIDTFKYNPKKDNQSAKSVLIPGNVAGLTKAHKLFGSLPLTEVMKPAIECASKGFPIDLTLSTIILDNIQLLQKYSSTTEIYLPNGFPLAEGDTLKQKDLGETLKKISLFGRSAFYEGETAKEISNKVTENGGLLTEDDLHNYKAEVVEPLYGTYRGYKIISANAPQSGEAIIEALNILENVNLSKLGHFKTSAETLHLLAETFRRVYADRNDYLGDPDFENVPLNGLTSKDFARTRFKDIDPLKAKPGSYRKTKSADPFPFNLDKSESGSLIEMNGTYFGYSPYLLEEKFAVNEIIEEDKRDGHTTHIAVIDKDGNMVSLTQTLGTFFGSGLTVKGVLLNCSMANYSSVSKINLPKPNNRPRSAIAPTIILKDNKPFMSVGSPGATRIIATVVQLISNVIDFRMNVNEANDAPRFYCQKFDNYLHLENRITTDVQKKLKMKGHRLKVYGDYDLFFGGAQIILVNQKTGVYCGSADPRRGGAAMGF